MVNSLSNRTKLVGIVNITPDSFSDGGNYVDTEKALTHVRELIKEEADALDIGAESTRPGATALTSKEEWERLEPILPGIINLAHKHYIPVSLDTRHVETAQKAINLGIDWLNDVTGFHNEEMISLAVESKVMLVVMHSLSIPADKNITLPEGTDVIETLLAWGKERISTLTSHGIAKERIILDPGIGFGKTAEQSLTIIKNIKELQKLNAPLFVGHSRKSFLSLFTKKKAADRDEETAEVSAFLAKQGVDYLRVHAITSNKIAVEQH